MNRRAHIAILAVLLAVLLPGIASGIGYTVAYENGNVHGHYEGFHQFAESGSGDRMAGMRVTVTFDDASIETAVWKDLGGTSGGAFGSSWSLEVDGDTDGPGGSWLFTVDAGTPVDILEINAFAGNAVFDVKATTPNTPESGGGAVFAPIGMDAAVAVDATYWDAVIFVPNLIPAGDIYSRLVIEFDISHTGTYEFVADTDCVQLGLFGNRRGKRTDRDIYRRGEEIPCQ